MATAQLMPIPVQTFTDGNGNPLAGGLLYSYAATTTTPQATYTDQSGVVPNANPVVLSSIGQAQVWLSALAYKFVLKDSLGNTIWTVDNVSIINPLSLTLSMFPAGLFTANTAGRAPFAAGLVNTAMCDSTGPLLGANTPGRALMADGFLTQALRAPLGQQVSATCGVWTTGSASMGPVTNLSVTITTTGRPVYIALVADGGGSGSYYGLSRGANQTQAFVELLSGVTVIKQDVINAIAVGASEVGIATAISMYYVDIPVAGTYTYSMQAAVSFGTNSESLVIANAVLIAFEL